MKRSAASFWLLALFFAGFPTAHGGELHREHSAHTHGLARINVALDRGELHIEFMAPWANIVGFEHAPANDAQRRVLKGALKALEEGGRLFVLPAEAGCGLRDVYIDAGRFASEGDHEHRHHHHAAGDANDTDHSEVTAHYEFLCDNPERLTSVSVRLFELFPGNERIEVQVLSPDEQRALTLTPKRPEIPL